MQQVSINDNGTVFIGKINTMIVSVDFLSSKIDDNFSLTPTRDESVYVLNGTGESGKIGAANSGYGTTIFKVSNGMSLRLTATNGSTKTFRWAFTSEYPRVGSNLTGGQYLADTTSVDVDVTAPVDGYLCCSFGDGNFADIVVTTKVLVADFAKELTDGQTNTGASTDKSYLPLDGLKNINRKSDWTTETSTTTICTSVMLAPYDNAVLRFKLPSDLVAYVRYGNIVSGTSSSTLSSAIHNGGTFAIPAHVANICVIIQNADSATISAADVNAMVASGDVAVTYADETPNVVAKNIACEAYTKAVMYKAVATPANSYLHNIPVFAHISDIHGDMVRMHNCLEYCKYLGVDAVLNSGDTCCNKGSDGFITYNAMVAKYAFPTLVCEGNHDGWYPSYGEQTQNEKVYEDLISPNAVAFGYTLPSSSDYNEAPTYYYKDFSSRKIRVIVLNEYESGLNFWAYVGRITQKQIDWFIATLLSTPADYGVLLMYHASMFAVDKINDNDKFYNKTFPNYNYDSTKSLSGDPIGKIIDAFITKSSVTGTYTQTANGTTETVSYSGDFSALNSGVEFIAHLTGHMHRDYIGLYAGTAQRQVVLNITTGQSLYGFTHYSKANNSELPRGGHGAVDDAFNIYGIDRDAGTIRVARVGSNFTSTLTKRDFMEIAYR